jgi:aminopeptidase N
MPVKVLLGFFCLCVGVFGKEFGGGEFGASGAPIDSPVYRKYAPDRDIDILHLSLDVTPNFREKSVAGQMTMRFRPISRAVDQVRLDAVDLRVQELTSSEAIAHYENTGEELVITFKQPIAAGKEASVTVIYHAFPKEGLYFRTRDMGYEDEHLFSQGEDSEARHWYPCHDFPNEKFTSDVTCRVPQEMTVLSNGRLVSEEKLADGMKAVRWAQEKPHVSYLISLAAGRFAGIEDKYKDVPLAFYTPASQVKWAESAFRGTADMMGFFEKETGMPYPWAKYFQVAVNDFVAGGMENTSITTLTDGAIYPPEFENMRSSQGLVAHELAHQWFGDFVTCKDWSHIWLNEGFATYYALLYKENKDGRDDFLYGLWHNALAIVNKSAAEDSRPIVFKGYDKPIELFGYLAYPKGGWVLQMLRSQLGPELYRRCITTYLERHALGNVVTADLAAVVEELSGRSFDQFFDQWVYRPHHPELQASYSWDEKSKLAKVSISQVQPLTNEIGLFNFPLKLRFKGGFGTRDHDVVVKQKQEDFYTTLPEAPKIVRLDPDYAVLAKVTFELGRPLLVAQLKDESDVLGRIFALQQLSKSRDRDTVREIQQTLEHDKFYGVRIEAAKGLGTIRNDDALEALLAASKQEDARVRQQVVIQAGNFHQANALSFELKVIDGEKNPDILAAALKALGPFESADIRPRLLRFLNSSSYRNVLADAAISAIREQNDSGYIPELMKALEAHREEFTSHGFGVGIEALGYLARNEQNKSAVREMLLKEAANPRLRVRIAAFSALALLQDDAAIPVLERYASGSKYAQETGAAEKALNTLRSGRKPPEELQTLRSEVTELKRQAQELQKSVQELKKKGEVQAEPEVKKTEKGKGKRK